MMCVQKYLQVHSNRGNEAIVANEAMSVRVVRFPNALRFMTQIKGHVQKDTRVLFTSVLLFVSRVGGGVYPPSVQCEATQYFLQNKNEKTKQGKTEQKGS